MAATVYGRVQPFSKEKEPITAYLEQMSMYFETNDIAENVAELDTTPGESKGSCHR